MSERITTERLKLMVNVEREHFATRNDEAQERLSALVELLAARENIARLTRERDEAHGDAATLRGFVATYGMTPSMVASERDALRTRLDAAREMLQATRDHLKYDANSESGLVARIDAALEEPAP